MKAALIVIDMIIEFVYGSLAIKDAEKIIPKIKELLKIARDKGMPVIFTNDAHEVGDPELEVWGPHAVKGSDSAKVIPDFEVEESDYIVEKRTYSGFFNTDLEGILRLSEVDTVILTGVATSICVQHTAADAFYRGWKIIVVSDATADIDEEKHKNALETMKKLYGAKIMTTEEVKNLLLGIS